MKDRATENTEEDEFMKKKNIVAKFVFASAPVLVSCLIVLGVLCGKISAQDFKTLQPGIEYAEVTKEISG